MKLLKYIPVSLFILTISIWDIWVPSIELKILNVPNNFVNWCIFYYSFVYLSWFIYCVMEAIRTDYIYFGALGVGIGIRIYLELIKIGMTYEQYAHSVNEYQSRMLLVLWSCLTLLIPLIRWKNLRN